MSTPGGRWPGKGEGMTVKGIGPLWPNMGIGKGDLETDVTPGIV